MKKIISVMLGVIMFAGILCLPVYAAKASITFANKSVTIEKGGSYTLKPTVSGLSKYTLTWSTSNKNICTVDSKGNIKGINIGSAVITAKIKGSSLSAKCNVTVIGEERADSKITLDLQTKETRSYNVNDTSAGGNCKYSSSDTSVARVTEDGRVVGVKKGDAVITVKSGSAQNSSQSEFDVTVTDNYIIPDPLPNFDSKISAADLVKAMQVGINIGNSLDAYEKNSIGNVGLSTEMSWGNPKITKNLIDALKKKGFKTVRLSVTWHNHMDRNYNIDSLWMARVKEVVDYAINNDMYVILNMQNDNAIYDLKSAIISVKEYQNVEDNFTYAWAQIAETFAEYDEHLLFESMNEPKISENDLDINIGNRVWLGSAAERRAINDLNAAFVREIRHGRGNNPYRFLLLTDFGSIALEYPLGEMEFPEGDNRIIFSVQGFIPTEFATVPLGKDSFDSEAAAAFNEYFDLLKSKIMSKGVPVIVTSMAATNKDNTEDRATWAEFYVRTARSYGVTCIWWDSGMTNASEISQSYGIIDRKSCKFVYEKIADALVKNSK